ncbi:MAG: NAD(P)H-hydrate epimerase [Sedimentisphaerales bacterium]|nr:NAD(P)H-hydrate epimerase [Sedimentisphaerales bacterium]
MQNDSSEKQELVLSREQVRKCDKLAIEQFGIDGLVLMENAGNVAAQRVMAHLKSIKGRKVLIVAGCGNNGGDGFVVARHLFNNRYPVEVLICCSRDRIKGDALNNLKIIELMKIPIEYLGQAGPESAAGVEKQVAGVEKKVTGVDKQTAGVDKQVAGADKQVAGVDKQVAEVEKKVTGVDKQVAEVVTRLGGEVDLIVDALLGTGTAGPPREPIRTAIVTINQLGKKVVALDIPSGLDCDSGKPLAVNELGESEDVAEQEEGQGGLAICADETVTFAAMKKGFLSARARRFTGDITVASIGVDVSLLLKHM